jgi:putative hydrolase of the HAD superfamily
MLPQVDITQYMRPLFPIKGPLKPQGRPLQNIRCILFDVYGTLFISGSGDIGVAEETALQPALFDELLRRYNITCTPQQLQERLFALVKETHRKMKAAGISYPEVQIDHIWSQILSAENINTIRNFAVEYEWLVNPVSPMPNLEETLAQCKSASLMLGIISNAQFFTPYLFSWLLNKDLAQLGFTKELLIFSYLMGHAKPSPLLFEKSAEALMSCGISKEQVLYIGNDMLNDIWPAHLTGFKTALFAGDRRSLRMREKDKRCRQVTPDIVLTNLIQILDYIL